MHRKIAVRGFLFLAVVVLAASGFIDGVPSGLPSTLETQEGAVRFVVAPEGNTARYRVREQLAGLSFPNDAVGETTDVSGMVVLDAAGRVLSGQSSVVVNVASLKTDSDRRDNFIRRNTLQTDDHPTVTLVPVEFRGLQFPLPTEGAQIIELAGDLTIRGVTRPTIWEVIMRFHEGQVTGTAETSFTFTDFEMTKPRVGSVLSVAETIRLEYDFTMLVENVPGS